MGSPALPPEVAQWLIDVYHHNMNEPVPEVDPVAPSTPAAVEPVATEPVVDPVVPSTPVPVVDLTEPGVAAKAAAPFAAPTTPPGATPMTPTSSAGGVGAGVIPPGADDDDEPPVPAWQLDEWIDAQIYCYNRWKALWLHWCCCFLSLF